MFSMLLVGAYRRHIEKLLPGDNVALPSMAA
jgi:hypothetical protein